MICSLMALIPISCLVSQFQRIDVIAHRRPVEDAETRLFNIIKGGVKYTFCSAHSLLYITVYNCRYHIQKSISTDGDKLAVPGG